MKRELERKGRVIESLEQWKARSELTLLEMEESLQAERIHRT